MPSTIRLVIAGTAVVWIAACSAQPQPPPPPAATPDQVQATRVERGEYLVNAMGCDDCHTPWVMGPNGPAPDMTRRLSGHPEGLKVDQMPKLPEPWGFAGTLSNTAWTGPWGISYTANLTSDPNTGIGQEAWTEENFLKAIREGKHMGTSRQILPPMPWTAFRNLNDEDLKSIYAYLRTVPPINNHVPEPVIAEAGKQ
jgi:mono/diheme cytochrome c family protein